MHAQRLADNNDPSNERWLRPQLDWTLVYRFCLAGLTCWLTAWPPSVQGELLMQNEAVRETIHRHLIKPSEKAITSEDTAVSPQAHRYHSIDDAWEQILIQIFEDHWQSTDQDPAELNADLRMLARYFSAYPEVRQLLNDLHGQAWKLRYAPSTFKTEVRGNHLQVRSVRIYFDPRTAAQFRFQRRCTEKRAYCVASPADVLLHELIHAHIILTRPNRFIAQGGLDSVLYPHQHEQKTIAQEVVLYQAMTELDQQPRPLRTEHRGRSLRVGCITCVH